MLNKKMLSSLAFVIALGGANSVMAEGWNYNLADTHYGPYAWGQLAGNELCAKGTSQSPIDLAGAVKGQLATLDINYKRTSLDVVNNGHTIQVNISNGSNLQIKGKTFKLLQFHFHSPSEHARNGYRYPMEAHFVHKADDGEIAVIGVFIKEGLHNRTLQKIWDIAPHHEGEASSQRMINPSSLIGDEADEYYGYSGSLTTPPCSEGLRWHVMSETIEASREQIDFFVELLHDGHNARPIQDLNGRSVIKSND